MDEETRKANINFIYEVCFKDPALRTKFFEEWKYVAESLVDGTDEMQSDAIIEAVADWLEIEGGY